MPDWFVPVTYYYLWDDDTLIGFVPLSEEQEIDGVRFTPMKYMIKK